MNPVVISPEIQVFEGRRYRRRKGCYRQAYVYLHRVVWVAAHGPIPKGYDIHHINGDWHDNRLENLQLLTHGDHRRHHARLRREIPVLFGP